MAGYSGKQLYEALQELADQANQVPGVEGVRLKECFRDALAKLRADKETQLKNRQSDAIFANGFAIGVAVTGACFPFIAKFAPSLVQSPDCQIPVLEQERK